MDPSFFSNHDMGQMLDELRSAQACGSSFKIQCWIMSSNELLMRQYQNLLFLNSTIKSMLEIEHMRDIIAQTYEGGYGQYVSVLKNLTHSAGRMVANINVRYSVLIEASIVLNKVKAQELAMAQRQQQIQQMLRKPRQSQLQSPVTQRPQIQISIV